jgi:hypothetical protein
LRIPRLRMGSFFPPILEPRRRIDASTKRSTRLAHRGDAMIVMTEHAHLRQDQMGLSTDEFAQAVAHPCIERFDLARVDHFARSR